MVKLHIYVKPFSCILSSDWSVDWRYLHTLHDFFSLVLKGLIQGGPTNSVKRVVDRGLDFIRGTLFRRAESLSRLAVQGLANSAEELLVSQVFQWGFYLGSAPQGDLVTSAFSMLLDLSTRLTFKWIVFHLLSTVFTLQISVGLSLYLENQARVIKSSLVILTFSQPGYGGRVRLNSLAGG